MIGRASKSGRRGITLLEVLTAIFIMGVGLLAILTLFPLGALSMAKAVRDDRAAAAGANAAGLATAMDLRNDPTVVAALTAAPANPYLPPDPNGPSYPVFVDPLYFSLGSTSIGALTTGATPTPGMTRCTTSLTAGSPQAIARWFTFPDEITFQTTGQPVGSQTNPPTTNTPGSVNRPGTYSWTYLVRRPRSVSAALTEVSVVVYASRATDSVSGETIATVAPATPPATPTGLQGTNTVAVVYTGDKPNFRKGSWILDTSYQQLSKTTGKVNGYFYQVAAVTDTGAGAMTLELETTLKENLTTLVLLENVITVLDRGASWRP